MWATVYIQNHCLSLQDFPFCPECPSPAPSMLRLLIIPLNLQRLNAQLLYPQYPLPHAMALLNALYVTNYLLMHLSPQLTLKWLEYRPHHIQLCIFKSQPEWKEAFTKYIYGTEPHTRTEEKNKRPMPWKESTISIHGSLWTSVSPSKFWVGFMVNSLGSARGYFTNYLVTEDEHAWNCTEQSMTQNHVRRGVNSIAL